MAKFGTEIIGLSSSTSLVMLLSLNGVGIPARLIPALLAHFYFGSFNLLIPFSFGTGIVILVWQTISDVPGFIALAVLFGIFANAVQVLFPAGLAGLTTDLTKMGTRIGMILTLVSVACLVGPPISGLLIAHGEGSFRYAQIFAGTSVIVGTCIISAARWMLVQKVTDWKRTESPDIATHPKTA